MNRGLRAPDEIAVGADARREGSPGWLALWGVVLFLGTCGLFSRALDNDFITLDDGAYVTDNAHVRAGMTGETLGWLTRAIVVGNWHPLTMLTHAADCQLWGLDPRGHHLTNVVLHALNAVLVLCLFHALTGRVAVAVAAAAWFAWHPLRVESVAWVAERKDVLSGLWGLATLWMYVAWGRRGGWWRYGLVLVGLALGLLSKPMLVTLPCVMLLLDYWPLKRCWDEGLPADGAVAEGTSWRPRLRHVPSLVVEKLPLFALAALDSWITFRAQYTEGVRSFGQLPLSMRLTNALVAYADYAGQMAWPMRLAVVVPHPTNSLAWTQLAAAGAGLAIVSLWVMRGAVRRPYALVGWLWFLGMLVPVIGLVQVGGVARADRYTYLPSLGIALVLFPWLDAWAGASAARRRGCVLGVAVVLAGLAAMTWQQLGVWQNSETLYRHATQVTKDNFLAHELLAGYLAGHERYDEAEAEYRRSLAITGSGDFTRLAYAGLLVKQQRFSEAREQFLAVLKTDPLRGEALLGLAQVEEHSGAIEQAVLRYQQALTDPRVTYTAALRLAWLLTTHPAEQVRDISQAQEVMLQLARSTSPDDPRVLQVQAALAASTGNFDQGLELTQRALEQAERVADTDASLRDVARQLRAQREHYRRRQVYLVDPVGGP